MRFIRRFSAAAAALLMAIVGAVVSAPSASAVGCWGDYCSGKDPMSTGCYADAYTAAYKDFQNGRLEVRYSPRCKTNWARVTIYPIGWALGVPTPIRLTARQDTGYTQSVSWSQRVGQGTYWTPMIYSPVRLVRAEATLSCNGVGDCVISALTGNPVVTRYV